MNLQIRFSVIISISRNHTCVNLFPMCDLYNTEDRTYDTGELCCSAWLVLVQHPVQSHSAWVVVIT